MHLAPIVLFVYNRLEHTKQTVEALQKNKLANKSELFIYSDGAKNSDAKFSVNEVRGYIDHIDGFKKVTIIKRERNYGLSNSIVDGVTKIIDEYEKVIVLEDDLVTGKYFLQYMNDALEEYKEENQIWQITGYNYDIERKGINDTFLFRGVSCWSWATWKNRWENYNSDISHFEKSFSKNDKYKFNINNSVNMWRQIELNKQKKIKTWCIFLYASMFEQNGLCLYPKDTMVKNIGHDSTGVHCNTTDEYNSQIISNRFCKIKKLKIEEDNLATTRIEKYFRAKKKNIFQRIKQKLKRVLNG